MQRKAGVVERMDEVGRRFIRPWMPEQHREFFVQLPTLWVGSIDSSGWPWASVVSGEPGFITSPDNQHLLVRPSSPLDGSLSENLSVGAQVGIIGIQPHTRRRNRANGTVVARMGNTFAVKIEQSFGNCPQYIQARKPIATIDPCDGEPTHLGPSLNAEAHRLISQADTAFIASSVPNFGADMSHRGGRSGFVRIEQTPTGTVLTLPDFRGNFLFNTIGNLVLNPRAGLLFVDYETGACLQLGVHASLIEEGPELGSFTGAQRLLRLTVKFGVWLPCALPIRWSEGQPASQIADTGRW